MPVLIPGDLSDSSDTLSHPYLFKKIPNSFVPHLFSFEHVLWDPACLSCTDSPFYTAVMDLGVVRAMGAGSQRVGGNQRRIYLCVLFGAGRSLDRSAVLSV